MIIKPTRNMMLIEKAVVNKTTESGIIIQSKASPDKTVLARVVAVGPGDYNAKGEFIKPDIKVGEYVVVFADVGEELKIAGEGKFIVSVTDVIAVVED